VTTVKHDENFQVLLRHFVQYAMQLDIPDVAAFVGCDIGWNNRLVVKLIRVFGLQMFEDGFDTTAMA
jgi:hypothetical protein